MTHKLSMRQTITTAFLPPTNHRPSRIKATAEAGSVTLSWDHGKSTDANHIAALEALLSKLGWSGDYIAGWEPKSCVFIWVEA